MFTGVQALPCNKALVTDSFETSKKDEDQIKAEKCQKLKNELLLELKRSNFAEIKEFFAQRGHEFLSEMFYVDYWHNVNNKGKSILELVLAELNYEFPDEMNLFLLNFYIENSNQAKVTNMNLLHVIVRNYEFSNNLVYLLKFMILEHPEWLQQRMSLDDDLDMTPVEMAIRTSYSENLLNFMVEKYQENIGYLHLEDKRKLLSHAEWLSESGISSTASIGDRLIKKISRFPTLEEGKLQNEENKSSETSKSNKNVPFTLQALAKKLKIDPSKICKIKRGFEGYEIKFEPSFDQHQHMKKISKKLKKKDVENKYIDFFKELTILKDGIEDFNRYVLGYSEKSKINEVVGSGLPFTLGEVARKLEVDPFKIRKIEKNYDGAYTIQFKPSFNLYKHTNKISETLQKHDVENICPDSSKSIKILKDGLGDFNRFVTGSQGMIIRRSVDKKFPFTIEEVSIKLEVDSCKIRKLEDGVDGGYGIQFKPSFDQDEHIKKISQKLKKHDVENGYLRGSKELLIYKNGKEDFNHFILGTEKAEMSPKNKVIDDSLPFTLDELAKKLEVNPSKIRKIEKDSRFAKSYEIRFKPSFDQCEHMQKISEKLKENNIPNKYFHTPYSVLFIQGEVENFNQFIKN